MEELVTPKVREEMYDLIDNILETFAEAYKLELQDQGWTPPA